MRYPTLAYQHEQPSHILERVATKCSVAFPVRQPVSITSASQRKCCSRLTKRSHINVEVELSEHELRSVPLPGGTKPIYAGAAGKAILAWWSGEAVESFLKHVELLAVAPRTITKRADLMLELTRTRSRGYAISVGETEPWQAASAAPIFGAEAIVVGCLNISGPTSRLPPAKLRANGELAVAATKRLGCLLVSRG